MSIIDTGINWNKPMVTHLILIKYINESLTHSRTKSVLTVPSQAWTLSKRKRGSLADCTLGISVANFGDIQTKSIAPKLLLWEVLMWSWLSCFKSYFWKMKPIMALPIRGVVRRRQNHSGNTQSENKENKNSYDYFFCPRHYAELLDQLVFYLLFSSPCTSNCS